MNSFILSLKFISVQNKFSYRLVFEIALIITLVVSISGMVNGASTQFSTIIGQTNTNSPTYLITQKGKSFESSQIPVDVIKKIDTTFFLTYSPLIYKQAIIQNNESVSYIYTNFTSLIQNTNNFTLVQGSIPTNSSEIMIGQGLKSQFFNSIPIPSKINLIIDNKNISKTITGIFSENTIYNYGILENINYIWSNLTSISMYLFQIKNSKVSSNFQTQTQQMAQDLHPGLELQFSPLQKTSALGQAFYNDLNNLFIYLEIIMMLLLALKITHASYTLLNRYYEDFLILQVLGMSKRKLQIIFSLVLILIGNVGLLYGFVAGIALPHIFLLLTRMVIQIQGLYVITPNFQEMISLTILINLILIVNSFWIMKIDLQDNKVSGN